MSLDKITHENIRTDKGGVIILVREHVMLLDLEFINLDKCDLMHIGTAAGKHVERAIHVLHKNHYRVNPEHYDDSDLTEEQELARQKLEDAARDFARALGDNNE